MLIHPTYDDKTAISILQELNETFENFDQMAEKLALEMFIGNKGWSAA